MAARLRPKHQIEVREKIRASQLINRLTEHALGRLEKAMDASQVTAALGLLKKCVPDLSSVEHQGEIGHYSAEALTDGELANIASGRSNRVIEAQSSEEGASEVH